MCKSLAREMLPTGERFAFATPVGLVGFVPSHNTVLAFSLPIPNAVIWPIGWIIVLALLAVLVRMVTMHRLSSIAPVALLAVILGAISNLFDRTLRGGVTDYLAVTALFPAFNIADFIIMGGVVWWWVTTRTSAAAPD